MFMSELYCTSTRYALLAFVFLVKRMCVRVALLFLRHIKVNNINIDIKI